MYMWSGKQKELYSQPDVFPKIDDKKEKRRKSINLQLELTVCC